MTLQKSEEQICLELNFGHSERLAKIFPLPDSEPDWTDQEADWLEKYLDLSEKKNPTKEEQAKFYIDRMAKIHEQNLEEIRELENINYKEYKGEMPK